MEEKLSLTSRAQTKAKDIHSHMELAWEKERTEQKRLLEEAHNLALDLQQQLKSRDEEYSKERRVLLQQLEVERQAYNKEKRERDIAMAEVIFYDEVLSVTKCLELVLDKQHRAIKKLQTHTHVYSYSE